MTVLGSADLNLRLIEDSLDARCSYGLTQEAHSWEGKQGCEKYSTLKRTRMVELEGTPDVTEIHTKRKKWDSLIVP